MPDFAGRVQVKKLQILHILILACWVPKFCMLFLLSADLFISKIILLKKLIQDFDQCQFNQFVFRAGLTFCRA